jgi:hypothetical protein
VYSALDRLESFREVADGEVVSETPTPFVSLWAFGLPDPIGSGSSGNEKFG